MFVFIGRFTKHQTKFLIVEKIGLKSSWWRIGLSVLISIVAMRLVLDRL